MKRIFFSIKVSLLCGFVVAAHLLDNSKRPGAADPVLDAKWQTFSQRYHVDRFGTDGYFVRAVENGHHLVNKTYAHAWRFTRKTAQSEINSCSQCHSAEELAYSFVSSDRYNPQLQKRVSFEENVMRCYIKHLDGYPPTIYDPAIRDIRILARLVAHDLGLVEGALPSKPETSIRISQK